MAILRPRNRLVYFRVSEDEYQRFNHICESTGSRSISDLARSAMQNMFENANNHEGSVSEKLTVLEAMVGDLNNKVQQLSVSLNKHVSRISEPDKSPKESGETGST